MEIKRAVFNIKELMEYTGLGRVASQKLGIEAGARIKLSKKRIGYLKSKIDDELERRAKQYENG